MDQYYADAMHVSLKTTICYRCFLKNFQLSKYLWEIANYI